MAINNYQLNVSIILNPTEAIDQLNMILQHLSSWPQLTLLGISTIGMIMITINGEIPEDQLEHLQLIKL